MNCLSRLFWLIFCTKATDFYLLVKIDLRAQRVKSFLIKSWLEEKLTGLKKKKRKINNKKQIFHLSRLVGIITFTSITHTVYSYRWTLIKYGCHLINLNYPTSRFYSSCTTHIQVINLFYFNLHIQMKLPV